MQNETATRLLGLNEQFYQTFGREFSSTRYRLQPGVRRVLDMLAGDETLLDLGCGNGELARELVRRGHRGSYLGLDFSLPLLTAASQGFLTSLVTFRQVDLGLPGWEADLQPRSFDLVTAFAFLHHIPGLAVRLDILAKAHALLRPGGRFIHSEWQFLNSEKLKARIQPWSEVGLDPEQLDPGDYLLDWRGGGRGLRYVHLFDEAELQSLAQESGFTIQETFLSDGANGRLGLYQVWEKA